MKPETGKIARARKMAREQAAQYIRPGDPGYWAKVDEIFHRLMREQLAFEDYKAKKNPAYATATALDLDSTAYGTPGSAVSRLRRNLSYAVHVTHESPHVIQHLSEQLYDAVLAEVDNLYETPLSIVATEWYHIAEIPEDAEELAWLVVDKTRRSPYYWMPAHLRKRARVGRNPVSPSSPTSQHNPPEDIDPTPYERFHGVPPDRVEERRGWIPGEMLLLGQAVDEGYKAKDRRSNKGDGPYVHDNGSGVRVWRRAKRGETPDKIWSNFPTDLTLMGAALGFTYRDRDGKLHEVNGRGKEMHTPESRRMIVITDRTGVKYVIEGGNLYVDDWIRN